MRTLWHDHRGASPGPQFPGIRSDLPLLPQLRDMVFAALDGASVEVVALGVSGLGHRDTAADLKGMLGDRVGTILLAHDSTTSYLGALGAREGAVVAAGTGAVTLAVGASAVRRVDGWGHLLGDEGSGFWIGRAALSAVLRAHDGRGPATALTHHALAEFGDLTQLYLQVQGDPGRVARIASWARRVSTLSPTDEVCATISREAGRHLAMSVAAGLAAVRADPLASTVGNVFRNPLVSSSFSHHLATLVPGVRIVPAAGSGLDGAAILPDVAAGSALGEWVDRST